MRITANRAVKIILTVVIFAVMTVNSVYTVSAEGNLSDYQYILREDNYGIIIMSRNRLRVIPTLGVKAVNEELYADYSYVSIAIGNAFNNVLNEPLVILVPKNLDNNGFSYDVYIINQAQSNNRLITYNISNSEFLIKEYGTDTLLGSGYYLLGDSLRYNAWLTPIRFIADRTTAPTGNSDYDNEYETYDTFVKKFHFTSNYEPLLRYNQSPVEEYRLQMSQVDIIGSIFNTDIYDFLETSDVSSDQVNQIVNVINNVINAGAGNTVPSGGDELAKVEDKLSSAEQKLEDKSGSLADSVKSEWTANISDTKKFTQSLATSAVEINNLYTTVMTAVPTEIKALFVAIPLLLFVGWLIGRVD